MRVTYSPEAGEAQSWDYVPNKVRQSDAEMIEKRAGMEWDEFNKALLAGAARPRKVLLWHLMRRTHPVLRWEDVPDFFMSEVQIELSAEELGRVRQAAEKADMEPDAKSALLKAIDEQLAEVAGDDAGKALSPTSEPATAG